MAAIFVFHMSAYGEDRTGALAEGEHGMRFLALLHELAALLEDPRDAGQVLGEALELMAGPLGILRGAISLLAPETGQIRIEACYGLRRAQARRGEYLRGEGITGRVIATGRPMLIADVSREPLFLNRTGCRDLVRDRLSFLCVPLRLNGQTVGALSVDQPVAPQADLERNLGMLRIMAAMLAPVAALGQEGLHAAPKSAFRPAGFVGSSAPLRHACDQIAIVAPSQTSVLLQGESGVGKELAAHAIHLASPRAARPFVALNCAALPESLIESELFGHERGAFTGASQMRKGRFEQASGGTLFLDEVGELSATVQAKLLRVLQEHSFERLGGLETLRCDVRLIAATNRDLARMAAEGAFRRDLFYRLNVFPIFLPPLRQRPEDILPLAAHFLEQFARANGKKRPILSLAAMNMLERYSWPGNIRELQNAMERAVLLVDRQNTILPRHLPQCLHSPARDGNEEAGCAGRFPRGRNLEARISEVEKTCITDALAASGGHMGKAASMLGLTARVMGLRMAKYGLDYKKFRKKG